MKQFSGIVVGGLVVALVMGSGTALTAQEAMLNVGDRAPIFEAVADDGELWRSREHIGQSILVVYFFPAAMTSGCTTQACLFRDNRSVLQELGAEVIGVSGDQIEGLKTFKGVNRLNFPLLSDTDGDVASAFGVPTSDGGSIVREVDGQEVTLTRELTMSRWTFVIGRDGQISFKETEVDPEGDSAAVIAHIRGMLASR